MGASLAVCILAALLATGACLQCEVCDGPGTSCTGDSDTCPAGRDSCGIALTEMTWAGMTTQSILLACVTSSQCRSGPVSMKFENGMEISTSFACCVEVACRTNSSVTGHPSWTGSAAPDGTDTPPGVEAFSVAPAATISRVAGLTSKNTTSGAAGVTPGPAGLLLPALAGLLLLQLLS